MTNTLRTFTCFACKNTYTTSWTEKEAKEEYANLYPEAINDPVEVACDDCNTEFRKWFDKLSNEEKQQMREMQK